MPRKICLPCGVEYRCKKMEAIYFDGTHHWYCDLFECPKCGHRMLAGFAPKPLETACSLGTIQTEVDQNRQWVFTARTE